MPRVPCFSSPPSIMGPTKLSIASMEEGGRSKCNPSTMNVNELIERAHAQAKGMGWWDQERNTGELLMLIVSECGEALEAHRSGKHADLAAYKRDLNDSAIERAQAMRHEEDPRVPLSSPFEYAFRTHIKDTFSDELADIVIRIADLLGHVGVEKAVCDRFDSRVKDIPGLADELPDNVGHQLLHLVSVLTSTEATFDVDNGLLVRDASHALCGCMAVAFAIAHKYNIDLERHIDLKLTYNKTRGIRHGKAY